MAAVYRDQPVDRVVAIVTVAYLEDYLGRVIATKLPGLASALTTKLFEGSGALSTLGARIDIGKALGLYDGTMHADLISLARIRNRFAHHLKVDTFSEEKVSKLCAKLNWPRDLVEKGTPFRRENGTILAYRPASPYQKIPTEPRDLFTQTAMEFGRVFHNYLVDGTKEF